jgi:hypothetical protein
LLLEAVIELKIQVLITYTSIQGESYQMPLPVALTSVPGRFSRAERSPGSGIASLVGLVIYKKKQ